MVRRFLVLCLAVCANSVLALAEATGVKEEIAVSIDAKRDEYAHIAREIWEFAELSSSEVKSSSLLQAKLKAEGFTVEAGVAKLETAFVATYGKGTPIVGILAEFDALLGLSQDAVPEPKILAEDGPGHGCGHNLFGTGSVAAAVAVKDWLAQSGTSGTIRLYGTPAEEQGEGKVDMALAGLFDDADVILHWHPYDRNSAGPVIMSASIEAKFRFSGISSHAAEAPEKGRSALDGVEAMNYMVNLMREHVPSKSRIHYSVTHGGGAPNVVPDKAEVHYYVRHSKAEVLKDIWSRVLNAAKGAALGTGTSVKHEILGAKHSVIANETLAKLMDKNLRLVGGVTYTAQERAFAEAIGKTLGDNRNDLSMTEEIQPYEAVDVMGSSDVGDVSMIAPTAGVDIAAWVPGTGFHTWQATAASGMSIGTKGMIVAAKVMAFTAVDVFMNPSIAEQARDELVDKRGAEFEYRPIRLRGRDLN
jgi:aminobenzoyl-glutamate utilization protein B